MLSISLITAVFNSSETLLHCLESVGEQTVTPEHILIDGKSTDDSLNLARRYTGHSLTICSETDSGIYDALNNGISKVNGEVVGILNSDDFYSKRVVLERVLEVFDDDRVDICYGDLCYVDRGDPFQNQEILENGTILIT